MELNIDIIKEQEKAQEEIKKQGFRVLVCGGTGCVANGALEVMEKFREFGAEVGTLSSHDKMTVIPTGCHGFCEQGVLVVINYLSGKNVSEGFVKCSTEQGELEGGFGPAQSVKRSVPATVLAVKNGNTRIWRGLRKSKA